MDSIFLQGLHKKEGEGLRVSLSNNLSAGNVDFKLKVVDNQYNQYPEMHISYKQALRLLAEMKNMMQEHHNLFKDSE